MLHQIMLHTLCDSFLSTLGTLSIKTFDNDL